jgi:protein-S-isoprenylcysteine O-methyltransferase Ste14
MSGRSLRLRAVWLIAVPFFLLAEPTFPLIALGGMLAALGLWIRAWSAGTIHKNERLTTTGPYAFTRNPLYVGSLLIGLGVAAAGGHWIWPAVFIGLYAALYSRTMAREAGRLRELFGNQYREYAANVPGFVPRVTPYRGGAAGSDLGFRWSQYLWNREWEALLGVVATFGFLVAKALWTG